MKKSKLLEILASLNPDEMERLNLYLRSNYWIPSSNNQIRLLRLFDALRIQYPGFDSADFSKQSLYLAVFPGDEVQGGRLEKVMSYLVKQIENFIVVESQLQHSDSFQSRMQLAEFYSKKRLKRLYDISIKKLGKFQSQIPSKDKFDLHNDHLLQQFVSDNNSINNKRDNDLNLPNSIRTLDIYYLANRLEQTCTLLAQSNFHSHTNVAEHLDIIHKLKPIIESSGYTDIPLIKVYSTLLEMLQGAQNNVGENLANIKSLESLLQKYHQQLSKAHLVTLHSFSRSFLLRNLNQGHSGLNSYAFQMYKDHLEKNLLSWQGGIHPANFKNIVSIALQEKAHGWVKQFLEKYKKEIVGTEHPEEVFQFNLANYYFHIGEIEKAQEALGDSYEDLYYKLAAKRLEIKIYCELKSDLLEYKLNAYKQFIHRISKSRLPEMARKSNNNFINALKQIISPTNISKANRNKLQAKIAQMDSVKDKEWLLSLLQG